jgi:hypothetical protein
MVDHISELLRQFRNLGGQFKTGRTSVPRKCGVASLDERPDFAESGQHLLTPSNLIQMV